MSVLRRIGARTGALAVMIVMFAVVAAPFSAESMTQGIGLAGFAVVLVVIGWWAARDTDAVGLITSLRDWLVIVFVLGIAWWVALTLFEGEHDVAGRLGIDFWSVMATVGLMFGAALVGSLVGRGSAS